MPTGGPAFAMAGVVLAEFIGDGIPFDDKAAGYPLGGKLLMRGGPPAGGGAIALPDIGGWEFMDAFVLEIEELEAPPFTILWLRSATSIIFLIPTIHAPVASNRVVISSI
jgi:hypothetical protein